MTANKDYLVNFGLNLKQVRKDKSLTVEELDAITGINHANLTKIENGQKSLTLRTILKLCKGLEVNADRLIPKTIIDMID